ncbi:hypothetical protein HPB49_016100 [Dermacentor silvarum]|uniref:Uncharacterized protein n=1 Tax=Dermacentor silvarum TaxID=543639 RepID=A0ACB8D6K5_DERSI|nr:sulfotransferase 2A8 [Dermacentor silvarum]KAH7960005.1 hypothetical protein HPB49_016100 [Dermacentor silvarum]
MSEVRKTRKVPFHSMIDGVPRCPFTTAERIRRAVAFVPEKGDLLQISYPKSGTHWVQYITQLILREGEYARTYAEFIGAAVFLDYYDVRWESRLAEGTLRLFMTHIPLRRDKFNPEAKYIYVARNPWDVCVSFYHHVKSLSCFRFEDGSFDDFFEVFIRGDFGYGDYFEHVLSAYLLRNEPNVLFLTYEELKRDTAATVLRMASFFGERYVRLLQDDSEKGRKRLELVLERAKPENMKAAMDLDLTKSGRAEVDARMKELNLSFNAALVGDETRFNFVRKAKVGAWKEYFNRDQLRRFEDTIVEKTKGSGVMELWADIRREALLLAQG